MHATEKIMLTLLKRYLTLVKTEDQNPAVFCNKSNMEQ